MTLLQAIFLGFIQGLSEFLPISSSGHLAIAQYYMTDFHQPGVLFDVLLHVGTTVAVMATSPFRRDEEAAVYRRLLLLLIAASVPTAIIGLTFKDFFEGLFENMLVVGSMLLVSGVLLFLAERFRRQGRKEEALTLSDALVVGVVQGLAIIPGISRSGSTIATLLFKGVDGETAARFSFLMALPAVFGAALLSLRDLSAVPAGSLPLYLAGAGIAFITGLLSIHFLMAIIRRRRLFYFAIYCWLIGSLVLTLSL